MTVRLPMEHKSHIAHLYVHENTSTDDIAVIYNRSPRTINRVLLEMGVARTPNRKPTSYTRVLPKEVWVHQPVMEVSPSFVDSIKYFFQNILAITKKHVHLSR